MCVYFLMYGVLFSVVMCVWFEWGFYVLLVLGGVVLSIFGYGVVCGIFVRGLVFWCVCGVGFQFLIFY